MPWSASLPDSLIPRQRLLYALADWRRYRLILATAPAGFGKTTTAGLWVQALRSEAEAPQVAYVAFDHTVTTAERMVELIGAEVTSFAPRMQAVLTLGGAGVFTAGQVLTTMYAEIGRCDREVILVIDDVHLIEFEAGLELLQQCIDHAPRNLHLALLSRTRPRVQISRLQLSGKVLQLGMEDLSFDHMEYRQFVERSRLNMLSAEMQQYFEAHTQGWAAGLQLLAQSLPATRSVSTEYVDAAVAAANLWDYLESEILRQMPVELRQLLVESSMLPFLSVSLCAEALEFDAEEVRRLLDAAIAASGLIRQIIRRTPTGDGRYRIHPVLRDYLVLRIHDQSSIERISQIRRRAAEWLSSNGEVDEALALLLDGDEARGAARAQRADDERLAAELIERACRPALLQTELTAVRRWLARLPEAALQARPRLALDAAWAAYHTEDKDLSTVIGNARNAIEAAAAAGTEPGDELRAELAALESNGAIGDGRFEDADRILKAAAALRFDPNGLASAYLALGDAYLIYGEARPLASRLRSLSDAAYIFERIGFVRGRIETYALESLVRRRAADTRGALESSRDAVQYMEDKGWSRSNFGIVTLWTYGEELYFSGAVREGLACLSRAEDLLADDPTRAFSLYHLRVRAQLCRIALGEAVEIGVGVDARDWVESMSKSKVITYANTAYLRILRDYRLGFPERCRDTMRATSISIGEITESTPYMVILSVLAGEVLSGDGGAAVAGMLRWFRDSLDRNGMVRMGLQVQMLHVLHLQQQDRIEEATLLLADLLPKLEASGLIRVALDFPVIHSLLQQIDADFSQRIRSAMRVAGRLSSGEGSGITPVEMRVLQCLDQGFDNRRIAAELYLTYETVRSYLKIIYRKLGAHSSAEALRIARDAGIVG